MGETVYGVAGAVVTTVLDQTWGERDVFITIVPRLAFMAHGLEIIIGFQQTSRDRLGLRVGISMSGWIFSLFDFLVIMMSVVITGTTIRPVAGVLVFVLSGGGFAGQSQQPALVVYDSDSRHVKPGAEISMK